MLLPASSLLENQATDRRGNRLRGRGEGIASVSTAGYRIWSAGSPRIMPLGGAGTRAFQEGRASGDEAES